MANRTAEQLPALTGSEKQVAWATKIRANAIATITEQITQFDEIGQDMVAAGRLTEVQVAAGREVLTSFRDQILGHTDAAWWIDQRARMDKVQLINDLGRRVQQAATQA